MQTTSNGYSAAQLRAAKCKRRKVNANIENASLPMIESMSFDPRKHANTLSLSNSVSPIGENNNIRWYRNNLYENNISADTMTPTTITTLSSANPNSVITCDIERENACEALRKKVIKRLIDVTSPTSEVKQNLFQKRITNDEHIKTIVEMSVEIESNAEDTKKMLMNNCL